MKAGEKDRQMALAKITSGPLADWILTSGLTHHEIVAIQAPTIEVDWRIQPEIRNPEIERLFALGITSVLIEGGSEIAASSLEAGIVAAAALRAARPRRRGRRPGAIIPSR